MYSKNILLFPTVPPPHTHKRSVQRMCECQLRGNLEHGLIGHLLIDGILCIDEGKQNPKQKATKIK